MRILYHYPLSPFSRKIRIGLKEKDIQFELISENFWERNNKFLALSPSGQVPVLIENDELFINDNGAITEYLEEEYPSKPLFPKNYKQKANVRAVTNWFDIKFYSEVSRYILEEKVYKCLRNGGEPNSDAIRAGKTNIYYHLDYIAHLLKKHSWLGSDEFSWADITAASHLSALDYLGDVPWEYNEAAKDWYSIVKSRPSFRTILSDRIAGFKPPQNYSNLDF